MANTKQTILQITDLSHRYPQLKKRKRQQEAQPPTGARVDALKEVGFSIFQGEIFGVLGPNGSGKTTLFKILSTLMKPSQGQVTLCDYSLAADPSGVRSCLGVVFQQPSLDIRLSAEENLICQGNMYGLKGQPLQRRVDELLDYMQLADRRDDRVQSFSGGMKRKLEIAKALLHTPRVLLLDEPDTGLDPGARRDVWRMLEQLRQDEQMTIILTTHLMDEADRCDRIAVISQGQLVALDTPDVLKSQIGGDVITLFCNDSEKLEPLRRAIESNFSPWPNGGEPRIVHNRIYIEQEDGVGFIAKLSQAFSDDIDAMSVGKPTLEDVFLHLTGHTLFSR